MVANSAAKKGRVQIVFKSKGKSRPTKADANSNARHKAHAPRGMGTSLPALATDGMAAYAAALTNPFSPLAVGCRVPEPYEVLTRTTKNVTLYNLTPSSATFQIGTSLNGPGLASGVIIPHANFTHVQPIVASVGTNCTVTGGQVFTVGGLGQTDFKITGNVGNAVLRSTYETYRLVAMGVRFKTNMSFTDAAGRIVVALVPSMNTFPTNTNSDGVSGAQFAAMLNSPYDPVNGQISSDILGLPTAAEYSMTDLLSEGGIEVRVPLTSPLAKQFLSTDVSGGPGLSTYNASNSAATCTNPDYSACGGFSNILYVIEGMKTGTSITIEVIQHFEGIPRLADATGTSGVLVDQSVKAHIAPVYAGEMAAQLANSRPVQGLVNKILGPARAYSDRKGGSTKTAINAAAGLAKKGAGMLAARMLGLSA